MKENPNNLEIVMMIASKDGSIRRTHIFKNVEDFNMRMDPPPAHFENAPGFVQESIPRFIDGTGIGIEFTALLNEANEHHTVIFDHTRASEEINDLDEFLRTFPAVDRLRMARRYVEQKDTAIQKFMSENAGHVIDYLIAQGYSITLDEDDCDCEDHCVC